MEATYHQRANRTAADRQSPADRIARNWRNSKSPHTPMADRRTLGEKQRQRPRRCMPLERTGDAEADGPNRFRLRKTLTRLYGRECRQKMALKISGLVLENDAEENPPMVPILRNGNQNGNDPRGQQPSNRPRLHRRSEGDPFADRGASRRLSSSTNHRHHAAAR